MGNTTIQTNLVSPSQVTGLQNLTDNMAEALLTLAKTYIPGITNFYKGVRPISSEDVQIPCLMLQPLNVDARMVTTAKYQKWYFFDFWFGVGDASVEKTTVKVTDVGEAFIKLFSNNALSDQGTAGATNKFKTNGTTWVDSEMTKVDYSVAFRLERPGGQNGPKYVALGNFQLKVQTVLST